MASDSPSPFANRHGSDIWIYELAHDRLTPLTTGGNNGFPVWSPDGTRIAFASGRFGHHNMFVQAADGSGPTERLVTSDTVQRPSVVVARWTDAELHEGRPDAGYLDAFLRAAADDAPDDPVAGLPDAPPESRRMADGWRTRRRNLVSSKST